MQHVVGIHLHPAVARDPCRPECLDLLRQRTKAFLQRGHASLRLLRSKKVGNARKPRSDVEIVHSGARTTDEGSLGDCCGERLDGESLDPVPEGDGIREVGLLGFVGRLAVEDCVEVRERRDALVIKRLVCLRLGRLGIPFQMTKPCKRIMKNGRRYGFLLGQSRHLRVVVKTFAKPLEALASSLSSC